MGSNALNIDTDGPLIPDDDGQVPGQGARSPVTVQSRARERVEHGSEDLLALLVADVQDYAILALDVDGNVVTWNAGAERTKGYRSREIIGRHFSVFYPGEDVAAGKPEHELTIAAIHGRMEDEGWRVRKDGTQFWANVVITALRDQAGTLRGYGKVTRDLTERRGAEDALRAAEERFRLAFEDAPLGMAIVAASPDELGRLLNVNTAMCELTGYDRDRLLEMTLQSLTHPDALHGDAEAIGQLLSGRLGRYQAETRYVTASGDVIEIAVGLSLIRDDSGRPLHFIALVDDVSSRKRYESQLQHMANHDPLTTLPNRARVDEALRAHVARVRRHTAAGALLMIDIDHFKQVNDRLGHHAGDQVLISVARLLRSRVRESDVLARLGGDEFAVLMTEGDGEEAQRLARDLLDLVRRRSVVLNGGVPGGITASIGIAVFDGRDNLSAADILLEADTAMYSAKQGGRDRIATYRIEEGARQRRAARLTTHDQILAALKEDRFELLLQPVMDLGAGAIGTYEALLRMVADDGSVLAPAAFLHVAERFDQILPIDRWVIEHGVALLEHLPGGQALEINLSGRSLGDPNLAAHISDVLVAHHADPHRVIFEITEVAAIENVNRAREFAHELTALGCRFALDDFGAGFGSFYYLKYLPFDYLKIDGEFVRNCTTSGTDQLVIQALVQLAKGLGKETIAEFVENADILRVVQELGVDHAQGYEIARPLPLTRILGPGYIGGPTAGMSETAGVIVRRRPAIQL
jgi:diguanylate cyclase (GGDEF)-like protein/PAS domain S-box-containing protein